MRGDPLGCAEAEITRLTASLKLSNEACARLETHYKYTGAPSRYEQQRRRLAVLSAAAEMKEGKVMRMVSKSMFDKEAGVLAQMMRRWHPDDRPAPALLPGSLQAAQRRRPAAGAGVRAGGPATCRMAACLTI
eukprot:scaffold1699_cov114-Isochrysis_galbana.AAC.7